MFLSSSDLFTRTMEAGITIPSWFVWAFPFILAWAIYVTAQIFQNRSDIKSNALTNQYFKNFIEDKFITIEKDISEVKDDFKEHTREFRQLHASLMGFFVKEAKK